MARILVVDDEASVREFLARALGALSHDVRTAGDGSEALDALRDQRYDLLLSDIVMPGIDGIALALIAAKENPALRIVLMSGHPEQRERAHNLDSLVRDVLIKPFGVDEIRRRIAAALG